MAIKATDLRAGSKIHLNDDIWVVMETMHRTPGKGQAVMQVRIRSLTSGKSQNERFRSTEFVESADLINRKMEYLYADDDMAHFMDSETYEQVAVNREDIEDELGFMKDNMEVTVQFHEEKALGVELPPNIILEVTQTEPGVKGDTVNQVMKPATLETGVEVQVPLFVNEGDKIKVDTRTKSYLSRA